MAWVQTGEGTIELEVKENAKKSPFLGGMPQKCHLSPVTLH